MVYFAIHFLPGVVLAVLFIGIFMVLKAKQPDNTPYKAAVGLALMSAFLLFWVNGAVGIIGTAEDDINMMYNGVLAIGLVSAIVARFRPDGMTGALFVTASAQALTAVIALIAGMHHHPGSSLLEILVLNGFFVLLFVGSALLFRQAARKESSVGAGTEG